MRLGPYVFVTLFIAAPVAAQSEQRLVLADVVAEALRSNPEIAAAEHRYEAARQRPAQERSLPDPMISAGYNSSGNPLPGAGLGTEPTANIGVMVSQEIPYPGKLALRSAIASREADAEQQQIEAARLSVTARVKQAYYALASTYAVGDVVARNKATARHAPESQREPLLRRPGRAAGRHQSADAAQHPRAPAGTRCAATRHTASAS